MKAIKTVDESGNTRYLMGTEGELMKNGRQVIKNYFITDQETKTGHFFFFFNDHDRSRFINANPKYSALSHPVYMTGCKIGNSGGNTLYAIERCSK